MQPTFVLIHGAWHGSWCWDQVAARLRAQGARVYSPTLTGLAERAHLMAPTVGLSAHVQDVLSLIEFERLDGCVLVGHSYGGNILTALADRLRERVAHYVYLDAVVPADDARDWSWSYFHTETDRQARLTAIRERGDGRLLPPPPASAFGLSLPEHLSFVQPRLTPMPAATYTEVIAFRNGGSAGLRRSYVAGIEPRYPAMTALHERLRDAPGWQYQELPGGHDLMVTEPQRLAQCLWAMR